MKKTINGVEVELKGNTDRTTVDCDNCVFDWLSKGCLEAGSYCSFKDGGYWALAENEQPKTDEQL